MTPVVQLEDLVDQCRAAELLARLVHRLPGHQLVWFLHEDGIVGHPATHIPSAEARARFTAWAQMLGLQPDPEQLRRGTLRLRAQGLVDGVQVTLSAQCYTH